MLKQNHNGHETFELNDYVKHVYNVLKEIDASNAQVLKVKGCVDEIVNTIENNALSTLNRKYDEVIEAIQKEKRLATEKVKSIAN